MAADCTRVRGFEGSKVRWFEGSRCKDARCEDARVLRFEGAPSILRAVTPERWPIWSPHAPRKPHGAKEIDGGAEILDLAEE
jgi:hypothetical protein